MADMFSTKQRSKIMSNVKGRENKATELRLVALFRKHGIRGWRRHFPAFGRPDFVFSDARVALFVDGCFWHGCPIHGSIPKTNRAFWKRKLGRNKARDQLVARKLKGLGWHVIRVWQHELREPEKVIRRVGVSLRRRAKA